MEHLDTHKIYWGRIGDPNILGEYLQPKEKKKMWNAKSNCETCYANGREEGIAAGIKATEGAQKAAEIDRRVKLKEQAVQKELERRVTEIQKYFEVGESILYLGVRHIIIGIGIQGYASQNASIKTDYMNSQEGLQTRYFAYDKLPGLLRENRKKIK